MLKVLLSRLQMCERTPMSHFEQVNGYSCGPACSFSSYLGPACLFGMICYRIFAAFGASVWFFIWPCLLIFRQYLGPACLFGLVTKTLPHWKQVNGFYLALPAHFSSYISPACSFGMTTRS